MHGLVNLPIVPVRLYASETSELTSQLLYGELIEIIETDELWYFVSNQTDQYSGWVDRKMIKIIDDIEFNSINSAKPIIISNPFMEYFESETSEKYYLPAGSALHKHNKGSFVLNSKKIDLQSYYLEDLYGLNSQHLIYIAKQFLNAPYLWGGKSILGIDCSGLVQLSFYICGMKLPRDASHQLIFGVQVDFLTDAKAGDLAFFENAQGQISHVGILINNHQIIHASGWVKIENIDAYGIISSISGEYTHTLSVIKRYF